MYSVDGKATMGQNELPRDARHSRCGEHHPGGCGTGNIKCRRGTASAEDYERGEDREAACVDDAASGQV